jgi:hypothetical protein
MARTVSFQSSERIDRLCKALGEEPSDTARIIIDIQSDCMARVYVEKVLLNEQLDILTDVLMNGGEIEDGAT